MAEVPVLSPTDALILSEEAYWVARCRKGDESAMAALVSKHRKRLIRVACNILRDSHEAEDVAQEAFVRSFREIGRLRNDQAFASYIYKICVRLCMDKLRCKRADPGIVDKPQASEAPGIETKMVVESILSTLSPELKATLVLREMEQLSYEEVAEVLHVPVGTVRSRLHTAREKFRAAWSEAMREHQ
ncbi:MAG: sigma-70 family RNA polymerase sigma factor [Armatimonadetes bacterium]|nr:sigma-70 family RNA polymerase sigma factor [Armatimonadota bacterium]